jgi:hypothetical protein
MICFDSPRVRYSKSLLLTDMNSSVWTSKIVEPPREEVSLGVWLQARESQAQGHGISQAMKRIKEKSGKHFLLVGVMFHSTIGLYGDWL